ncbi:rhophilin-2 isoform X2 [Gadus morhua]|uniref:rhophilin-2 isoform X2 n=1 Tax=Gadus morhua TaxID=8049 RepID=UPI0011B67319|nr:rhophilin-2 isoform X2 [Gadus morhua]
MTDTILPKGIGEGCGEKPYFKKIENADLKQSAVSGRNCQFQGCNPFAQTGRSKLQNQRAGVNQQIIKQMRMRAGAENLLKATNNNKVREMVGLELSYVNSNLQLLMEELEALNSSVDVYQSPQEMSNIPLIPLGLKETKEVDFSVAFKDFILEHYSEDGNDYEDEIADLMDLRQACRTPARSEAGMELLAKYYNTLPLMESRFFTPNRQSGLFFTWYDSFTGVPLCQQNISLEKASVLFNMAALFTQIGTRSNRQTLTGLDQAVTSFQKAAGVLNHLRDTFTHIPSYDLSPAMLAMLSSMMLAQAQECLFERSVLPGIRNHFLSLLRMAQEAAKVSDIYDQVHQSMVQTPIKDNVPLFWSSMCQVKTNHYRSLAHYFLATALLDHQLGPNDDEDQQEKTLSQVYDSLPEGRSPLDLLKKREERRLIGKAHLRRAVMSHEEALRVHGLCRHLKKLDVLEEILQASLERSKDKFSANDNKDEFTDYMEAPDIISKTEHSAHPELPSNTKGPLSFFNAKQRWTAPRSLRLVPKDGELGFTLKGEPPVQVVSLNPSCAAAVNGLKEGDYIVAVGDIDCKGMSVSQVIGLLKDVGEEGVDLRVVSLMDGNASMHTKSATYCGLPKTYSMICLAYDQEDKSAKGGKVTKKPSFLSWGLKNRLKSASTLSLPSAEYSSTLPWNKTCTTFPGSSSFNDSSLY